MSTSHIDTFLHDKMPPTRLWPEMNYSVLPELAAYPNRMNVATELLDKMVENGFGEKRVLHFDGQIWTYGDLLQRANQVALI